MDKIKELLQRLDKDINDRDALRELADLNFTTNEVLDKLEEVIERGNRRSRKAAQQASRMLSKVPLRQQGSFSSEPSGKKKTSMQKGLLASIREKHTFYQNRNTKKLEQDASTGQIALTNTGERSRITGIDLILDNVSEISSETIEEKISIEGIMPGADNTWTADYTFNKKTDPLEVAITYSHIPDETSRTDVLICEITISNTLTFPITDIQGQKEADQYGTVIRALIDYGEILVGGNQVIFNIDRMEAGESVAITLQIKSRTPSPDSTYVPGNIEIRYNSEKLISGISIGDLDGVSDIKQSIRRRQREDEPEVYDCEALFENRSEFVYEMDRYVVFQDEKMDNPIIDWPELDTPEQERYLKPREKKTFSFVLTSNSTPSFGNYINFRVQHFIRMESTYTMHIMPRHFRISTIGTIKTSEFDVAKSDKAWILQLERLSRASRVSRGSMELDHFISFIKLESEDELREFIAANDLDGIAIDWSSKEILFLEDLSSDIDALLSKFRQMEKEGKKC